MATIEGGYTRLDLILRTTLSKCYLPLLLVAGVQGESVLNSTSHSHSGMILFSCTSRPDDLDQPDPLLRSPEHTEACKAAFDMKTLWEKYRIIDNVTVSLLALTITQKHSLFIF